MLVTVVSTENLIQELIQVYNVVPVHAGANSGTLVVPVVVHSNRSP